MIGIQTVKGAYERNAVKMMKNGISVNELIAYSRGYNDAMVDAGKQTKQESKARLAQEIKALQALAKVVEQGGSF